MPNRRTKKGLHGLRTLEIFEGQYLLTTRSGKNLQYKFLDSATVNAAFKNAPVDSGWIPTNVIRCGSTPKGNFVALFVPAQKHNLLILNINGRRNLERAIYLPSLVFFGYASTYYIWAIKENTSTPNSQLYRAPLPNVFDSNTICWGANKKPKVSIENIKDAWALFKDSPFNGHTASNKVKSHRDDARTLLLELAQSGAKFPLDELLQTGSSLQNTIAKLIATEDEDDEEEDW